MILRTIKQLNPKDAKTIREKSRNLNNLKEIFNSSHYIYDDFQNREKIKVERRDRSGLPIVEAKMGSLTFPKFVPELSQFGTFFYQRAEPKKFRNIKDLSLNIYLTSPCERATLEKVDLDFILGNFSTQVNNMHAFRIGSIDDKYQMITQNIINFFYNKKTLYNKFFRVLTDNKTVLIRTMGTDSYEDFLSLFSANLSMKNIPDFSIPKENSENILIFHRKSEVDVREGQDHIGSFYKAYYSEMESSGGIETVNLLLNEKNQLTIDIGLDEAYIMLMRYDSLTSENINEIRDNKEYKNLINNNINIWLKSIVQMSNFASEIYEKVKPKIVIENI